MNKEQLKTTKPSSQIKLAQWQLLAIASVILGLGFIWGQKTQPEQPSFAQPAVSQTQGNILPVKTIQVETIASYQTIKTYTGEVTASRTSEVGFERGGKLIAVLVEEGERIKQGMELAKLDTANLKAERKALLAQKAQAQAVLAEFRNGSRSETIAQAEASVRDLEQQLELEEIKNSRRKYLYEEGAIAKEQLDEIAFNSRALKERLTNAKSNLDELKNGTRIEQITAQQAVVDSLTAQIENLDITIAKSVLKAPFDGTVSIRNLDEGTVVETGQSILRLVEDVKAEVKVGIPTNLISQIQPESDRQIEIEGVNYQGIVKAILPEVDPQTRTRTVILTLIETYNTKVFPGQIARVKIDQDSTANGYWLPINALVKGDKGLWSCFAVVEGDNNSKVERRYLELLETREDRVLVRGTIKPGDTIVIDGTHRLIPGQLVSNSP